MSTPTGWAKGGGSLTLTTGGKEYTTPWKASNVTDSDWESKLNMEIKLVKPPQGIPEEITVEITEGTPGNIAVNTETSTYSGTGTVSIERIIK